MKNIQKRILTIKGTLFAICLGLLLVPILVAFAPRVVLAWADCDKSSNPVACRQYIEDCKVQADEAREYNRSRGRHPARSIPNCSDRSEAAYPEVSSSSGSDEGGRTGASNETSDNSGGSSGSSSGTPAPVADSGKDTLLPDSQNSTGGCVVDGLKVPVCTKADAEGSDSTGANNPIMVWIGFFVNVLSVVIVAGAAVMMAVAGLQYMMARDKAESVKAAKDKMTSVILGLVAYFFLFAFVQWLVPGGVF